MSAGTGMRLDPCLSGTAAGHPLWVVRVCVGSEDVCGEREYGWGVRVCVGSESMCGCSGEGGMCVVWMGKEEECVVWMWEEEGCVLLTHEFGIGNEACGDKFDCAL